MAVLLKTETILEIIRDTLDVETLARLSSSEAEMIVEASFTRLGGSGLVRWVHADRGSDAPIPGHGPFSGAWIEEEDLQAGQRIIARAAEQFS